MDHKIFTVRRFKSKSVPKWVKCSIKSILAVLLGGCEIHIREFFYEVREKLK